MPWVRGRSGFLLVLGSGVWAGDLLLQKGGPGDLLLHRRGRRFAAGKEGPMHSLAHHQTVFNFFLCLQPMWTRACAAI